MTSIISLLLSASRTMMMLFVLLLAMGTLSYLTIPKEAAPDIPIPVVNVSVHYEGIFPRGFRTIAVATHGERVAGTRRD